MSSVKDRIRNLQQQSANPQPSEPVTERAKAVERVSEPDAEQPQSLSQLKKKFDSNVTRDSANGLGARVARFDSDTSQSLKDRVRRLENDASDTGSLAARASAFEHTGAGVKDVAEQFSEQEKGPDEDNTALSKARAMFEVASKGTAVETSLSSLKISSDNRSKNVDIANHSAEVSAVKPSEPKPPPPTITSKQAVADGVSRRAAMFERAESEPLKSETLLPTQRDPPKSLPSIPPVQKDKGSAMGNAEESNATDEEGLRDELREVKRANEELVSMLLELTSAFQRLEGTRDELQKRIAALEKQ